MTRGDTAASTLTLLLVSGIVSIAVLQSGEDSWRRVEVDSRFWAPRLR